MKTGTIVRADDWGDYYIVRLDEPAVYDHGGNRPEELPEIAELVGNMDVLAAEASRGQSHTALPIDLEPREDTSV